MRRVRAFSRAGAFDVRDMSSCLVRLGQWILVEIHAMGGARERSFGGCVRNRSAARASGSASLRGFVSKAFKSNQRRRCGPKTPDILSMQPNQITCRSAAKRHNYALQYVLEKGAAICRPEQPKINCSASEFVQPLLL